MVRILDAGVVDELIDETSVLESIRELFELPPHAEELGFGRIDLPHPNGWLRSLPAYVASKDLLGFKVLHRTDGIGMRYTIYVHRLSTGELWGIVDALEITNLRTGAVSAVATDQLAVENVNVVAIVGTGPVARGQLRAIEVVRPAAEIRVFARTPASREAFVAEMGGHVSGDLVATSTLEEAVSGAQVVTLATKAASPVFLAEHMQPGMHVNSVGPASRDRVEVDPAIFDSFDRFVCDSAPLVLDEAGDAYLAVTEYGLAVDRALELSSVVTGVSPARLSPDEVTLFKSVGNGAQDLIVAARVLEAAEKSGLGTEVGDVNSIKPAVPDS